MGLGAPKRREKLSHDPNNTAWTRATDNYGHRILASQGWKTGDYLGAENASHADHYTAANASHVRVLLREDNLGLGAKVGGKANAETFGLSTLSSIFGRLNGKSDGEGEKLERGVRDAELRAYQAQKHGYMNFVRGGLLVGDKTEEFPDTKAVSKTDDAKELADVEGGKPNKKRKASGVAPEVKTEDGSMERRKKQKPDVRDEASANTEDTTKESTSVLAETACANDLVTLGNDEEKAAKRQRKAQRRAERATREPGQDLLKTEKARLKLEKRARKEDRRKRKEEKRASKAAEPSSDSESTTTALTTAIPTPVSSGLTSGVSTPIQATPAFAGGRHAIRQRYIMQKRMASMDPRALNEILMIKAQV
ncbi:telomerase inhibitor [Friedmanniomyces endolithicus]|nr:telomerase inhibitor [Friedmanniomyces endolithicus]